MKKALIKFSNGFVLLCSSCRKIIKTEFTDKETGEIYQGNYPAQYCEKCKKK